MGFDLNRHWLDPSPWAHPTLHGVKQLIIKMYNDPVSRMPSAAAGCWPHLGMEDCTGKVSGGSKLGLHEHSQEDTKHERV